MENTIHKGLFFSLFIVIFVCCWGLLFEPPSFLQEERLADNPDLEVVSSFESANNLSEEAPVRVDKEYVIEPVDEKKGDTALLKPYISSTREWDEILLAYRQYDNSMIAALAEQGDTVAQILFSDALATMGQYPEAQHMAFEVATKGYIEGLYIIAKMFYPFDVATGTGLDNPGLDDPYSAYSWYWVAHLAGDAEASRYLNGLEGHFSTEELNNAKRRGAGYFSILQESMQSASY